MKVRWNKDQEGFQESWLWQFGEGPFTVLNRYDVPPRSQSPFLQMEYSPGTWYVLDISETAAPQYREEYGVEQVMFHDKWLYREEE